LARARLCLTLVFDRQHKDGHTFPIILRVNDVSYGGAKFYVASIEKAPETASTLVVSQTGTILSAAGCASLGFQDKELLGQNVAVLVPSPWKERHDHFMRMLGERATCCWKQRSTRVSTCRCT
jgi:hypothetical protein